MMIYLTSDLHFGDAKVIEYCNRPWSTVEEMNEALIENYNNRVGSDDTCYILGDVSFARKGETETILKRLHGRKILVRGNHDRDRSDNFFIKRCGFEKVYSISHTINMGATTSTLLCHYPYRESCTDGRYLDSHLRDEGKWLLHGHVHQYWRKKGRMINVGVDVWDYSPVSAARILQEMRDEA